MGVHIRTALLALTLTACGAPSTPPPDSPADMQPADMQPNGLDRASIDALARRLVEEGWAIGLAVGVVRGDATHLAGFGHLADGGPEVTADTSFEIGSVTKVYNALLLSILVREGPVVLDTTLGQALEARGVVQLHETTRAIPLHALATHTSGLPRLPPSFAPTTPADPYAGQGRASLMAALANVALDSPAGQTHGYAYSNFGAAVLGETLSLAAGSPWGELLASRILTPLGLASTTLADGVGSATGHVEPGVPTPAWHFDAWAPAGGLHSTARDQLAFVRAELAAVHDPNAPLAVPLRTSQDIRASTAPTIDGAIAMGWHVTPAGERWHNGQTGGFHSFIAFHPDSETGVVLLANTATASVDALGFALLRLLRGEAPAFDPPVSPPADPELLQRYVGRYRLAPEAVMAITAEGDALYVQVTGQSRFRLWPTERPHVFRLRVVPAEGELVLPDGDGPATEIIWRQGPEPIRALRVAD